MRLRLNWESEGKDLVCFVPNYPRISGPHGRVRKIGKKTFEGDLDGLMGCATGPVYTGRSRADAQRAVEMELLK